ncbi:MAG: hypothetical protein CMK09_06320 [Ponticaulis sp.]|nr:hypothetical protein [Ponticaulis sp.]|tara:strand:+ start:9517 stop:11601 length:2085 start_codon:yes stop_codon:yes gene_type:complete
MYQPTGKLCALAGICLVAAPSIQAQDSTESGVTSFLAADFDQYNPTNALDMVSQVPGFSIDNGDNVRGFGGAAGNVLIDGERPSTKSNLENTLRRIPVENVERIDLVRGASGDLDMRGQSRIVNVVLKEGATTNQINWSINPRVHRGGRMSVAAELDWITQFLGGDLTLSIGRYGWAERPYRRTERYDADGNQTAFFDQVEQTNNEEVVPGFEYERDFGDKTTLRLNGRAWEGFWKDGLVNQEFRPDGSGMLASLELGSYDERWDGHDFGGDVERDLTDDLTTKLIWYHRRMNFESKIRFDNYGADGTFLGAFTGDIDDFIGESILRSQTDWSFNDEHSIQFGIEGAYNFRDADRVFVTIDQQMGIPDNIPVSQTKVEEWRGEAFISDVWTPIENWTFEPGLKIEVSEISQSGDATAKRQFTYPKPSFSATYAPEEGKQWRFQIERRVDQLNFEDFVSNVNATDDNVTSGNPDLEPERAWRFEIGHERPLLTDGTFSVVGRYEMVEQVEGFVPIIASNGTVFDGPGNLGDGYRLQLVSEASIPTDKFGVKNGRLDLELVLRESQVDDPLTGESRRFRYEQPVYWYVEFRQDFPQSDWSWGFDYAQGSTDHFWKSREKVDYTRGWGDFDMFLETTKFFDLNIRLGVDNIFDQEGERTRTLYSTSRADGQIARRDVRTDSHGQIYYIRFKSTIGLG